MIELLRPQLAASDVPDIYTQVSWPKIIQPKLDGICCLAVNGVAMSRNMKPIPNRYVQKVFKELNLHGLHGELMVKGDFNDVQSAIMREDGEPNFYYVVYDKWDMPELPYQIRELELKSVVEGVSSKYVVAIESWTVFAPKGCEEVLEDYIQAGYEGAMLRDHGSLYKQGRHTLKGQGLLKLKKFLDDEATIIGFEEKLTNTNVKELDERGYSKRSSKKEGMVPAGTLGALIVRWRGVEFNIGSGFDDAMRQYIWDNRERLLGKLVTFRYQELSKYGIPRFPTFKVLWEGDKV